MLFYFESPNKPTEFNIAQQLTRMGHQACNDIRQAAFCDTQLTLPESLSNLLEHKHRLAQFLDEHCSTVAPPTFPIDAEHCITVCEQLRECSNRWILKPALLNNGEGIRLFDHIDDVIAHFMGNQRYDGPHVLQHYIEPPHCLQGHKYSIRLFVAITNDALCYLYPHGYFNIAKIPYKAVFTDPKCHLTNEHLSHGLQPDSIQIPTDRAPHFERIFHTLYKQCRHIAHALLQHSKDHTQPSATPSALSLFGFDFMLDEHLQSWLLEINHGPCFPVDSSHVLQEPLYQGFWQAVANELVLPIATQQPLALNRFIALQNS